MDTPAQATIYQRCDGIEAPTAHAASHRFKHGSTLISDDVNFVNEQQCNTA